jgi:hypothetical protein
MAQAESRLSRDIMAVLRARGIFCFKVHGGPTMMAGLPDIVACVPVEVWTTEAYEAATPERHGWFVGFETKTPTGGDPSAIQQHIHTKIGDAHGQVFVVRSVQDAVDAVETMSGVHGPEPLG